MSLIREFTKITAAGRRQYRDAKGKPFILTEEVAGSRGSVDNMLIHGDNKAVMKTLLDDYGMKGKLQMIYIDPPFFSRADYDAVLKAGDENIRHLAYGDKWEKGLSAYLRMLTSRLLLMRDLLSDTGLIWLHLDWHAVHYAKIIMDEIFGEKNFVNEIVWTYKSGGTSKKHFARKHDTILVYSKTGKYDFYPQQEKSYNRQFKPYRFKGVREYRDDLGWYTMVNMKDVWNIDMVGRTSAERTGYATQKPEQLIERILASCTREGDLCADFFCGSGTLPAVAGAMGRRFIACDSGSLAVESTLSRLAAAGESLRLYETRPETKNPLLSVKVEVTEDEIPGSDKILLRIRLLSLRERQLGRAVDGKSMETVQRVLKEDSLKMAAAWSVDFDHREGIHRPQEVFVRTKGQLPEVCEKIVDRCQKDICVKVVDIFGNVAYERIRYERNTQGKDH
ncbi:MAG: DNA methyltransferase [Emergencia sp.]